MLMQKRGMTVLMLLLLVAVPFVCLGQTIKVGAMFIVSGPMGGYGKHAEQAIQLATEEINASGGILGRNLDVLFKDTQLKRRSHWIMPARLFPKTRSIS